MNKTKRIFKNREVSMGDYGYLLYDFKLRKEDIMELEVTASGVQANWILVRDIIESPSKAFIGSCDGEPFAVHGVNQGGRLWGVCTDLVSQGGFDMIRWGREQIQGYLKEYPYLWNYMDCRNIVHRKYIEMCGFEFTGEKVLAGGYPFERFELRRDRNV